MLGCLTEGARSGAIHRTQEFVKRADMLFRIRLKSHGSQAVKGVAKKFNFSPKASQIQVDKEYESELNVA
ncbi:hypothetical protein RU08_07060 [Pseudomonas fulva]|uniref:Uncharacterized protein n=1 Tax=Pseudomonas fulva TaxID=47880 RepID=A0A0D0K2N2_9PSED|nr:hypothetical protein RU08_07060 [Pseudomonas fulva]